MTLLKRIEELEKLAEKATPGPWEPKSQTWPKEIFSGKVLVAECWANSKTVEDVTANALFIAASRTAIPELCAALREAIEILNNAASHECGLDGDVFPFAEDSRAFLDNHGLKEEK